MLVQRKKTNQLDLRDYDYKLFMEIVNGMFVCLIPNCNRMFPTYNAYLKHFVYNYQHYTYIERNIEYIVLPDEKSYKITMDPIEKELIKMNIRYNRDFINLKNKKNVTSILQDKVDFAIREGKMIVGFIAGLQGSGKTYFGISLAQLILDREEEARGYRPTMHIGFERKNTLQTMKTAKAGDVIIQDEVPIGAGFGDKTGANRLRNMLLVLRKAGVHFLFISPLKEKIPGMQFAIEVLSYTKANRVTKAVLYTKNIQAIGYCFIQVLDDDDPILIEYEKKKDEFVDKIQKSGGLGVDGINEDEFEADVKFVLEVVKKKNPNMKRNLVEKEAALYVKQNTRYQSWVADEVLYRIKEEQLLRDVEEPLEEDKHVVKQGQSYYWKNFKPIEKDIGILDDIYEFAKTLPLNNAQKRGNEAFKHTIIEGQVQKTAVREIFAKMGGSRNISMYFRKKDKKRKVSPGYLNQFQLGLMGRAGEMAAHKWYYPKGVLDGADGKPDIIGVDGVKVEVKTMETKRNPEDLAAKDKWIRTAINNKEEVQLVQIHYDIQSVRVYFYKVVYIEGTDIKKDIIDYTN